MHILLAEDAVKLSRQIVKGLTQEGHCVEPVYNGRDAIDFALGGQHDLFVLDVLMPTSDGFEVLRQVRSSGLRTPVLMLTAIDSAEDVVKGLDLGADDYITKPFAFEVLCARVRAVGRRGPIPQPVELKAADVVLDTKTREIVRETRRIALTRIEFALMEVFFKRAGQVVSRDELLQIGWAEEDDVRHNTLDVFIHNLRRKLTTGHESEILLTSRGHGYYARRGSVH